ncbi:type II toxin-antitoxin system VapC family toxin [Nocardia asteroides]|uniref:type II toxin-antitoxin system VapC family toxin n=1 Tax=Nocardia asteroides TaxID=1824 RepID=UPI001E38F6FB|nr:type II toxin-antitoxin system VapC family toxin [Nocardia asteroides]UGT58292.1 type II toxin-antitoxin system VapC family toxin [Nocardia asteroides]
MAKLIFDTGVLIAIDRGTIDLSNEIADDDNVAVPAVVIAEYLTGVAAQTNSAKQASARKFLSEFRAIVPSVPYDDSVAEHHADLLTYVRSTGTPRGAHDLIIAATARATGRTVLTTDKRARFDELPGVEARLVN